MSEVLNMYVFRTVDGIFMKINICCFTVILRKFHDFHDFWVFMRVIFFHLWVWETDKVPLNFLKQVEKFLEISFHTPSVIISQKMKKGEFFEQSKL